MLLFSSKRTNIAKLRREMGSVKLVAKKKNFVTKTSIYWFKAVKVRGKIFDYPINFVSVFWSLTYSRFTKL